MTSDKGTSIGTATVIQPAWLETAKVQYDELVLRHINNLAALKLQLGLNDDELQRLVSLPLNVSRLDDATD
jgi:hypothetical protein